MDKLYDYICEELMDLERKADKDGKLTMSEVQYMDTLLHAKKNLLKAEEMADSMEGNYSMRGGDGGSYARGRGRNAKRDSMGRYSRERDGRYSRYSREGNYSMAGDMVDDLRTMMENAPDERTRMDFEKMISKMENMR